MKVRTVLVLATKVILKNKGRIQLSYLNTTRGFESSSLQYVHFGTGTDSLIDTLQVIWPGGKSQLLTNIKSDQTLTLSYRDAVANQVLLLPAKSDHSNETFFREVTDSISLPYKRVEDRFDDFNSQPLIPHQISTCGPKIAVADINGDGLDDFFICGGIRQTGALFCQLSSGKFKQCNKEIFEKDSLYEDADAVFFDANGDGYKDLFVLGGGNQYPDGSVNLTDRLYLNDGKGNFRRSFTIPTILENKSVVIEGDFDHDGDLDLFIGGSAVAGRYGESPASYLLLNDGKGNFSIADESKAPGLRHIGMVTGAVWTDIDRDGWDDLVIVGEWMPITVFKNNQGMLSNITYTLGLQHTTGLWTTIKSSDLDGDGFEDLLIGNWGENSKLHASGKFPLKLYTGDIDKNGISDQLLAIEKNGNYYSFLGKDELEKHFPSLIRKKYNSYSGFAGQTIEQVFGDNLKNATSLTIETLSSVMLMNNRKGNYVISKLPKEVQWSPVFTFLAGDFNGDQRTDIIAAGNFYGVLPYEGRYDASYGSLLLGREHLPFQVLDPTTSGIMLEGEVRDSKMIRTIGGNRLIIFSRNNNTILFYKQSK